MARYVNRETDQFWEITLGGKVVETRYGAIGGDGETTTKTWPDAARARTEHDKVIAQKLLRGFAVDDGRRTTRAAPAPSAVKAPGARNPELEAAIAKDLDDRDAYLVYADWLTDQGDPRGELIALQAMRGGEKLAAKLLAKKREHFLGDLHELSKQTLQVTWRLGFIDTVRLEKVEGGEDDDDRSVGELLRALLQHPSGAFLRGLVVGTADGIESSETHYDSVLATLGDLCPRFVHSILLGDLGDFQVSWTHAGDASALWKLPSLRTLTVRAGSMDLGTIVAPELRELDIISGGLDQASVRAIATATWPKLEKLRVWFGSSTYGAGGGAADLAELLAAKRIPKVTQLGLVNAEFTDELCADLGTAKVLRQLEVLDLSKGTMSSAGVASLVEHRKAFAHLRELDVSDNCLTRAELAQLKVLCKKVVTGRQKDDDERYVSLGE